MNDKRSLNIMSKINYDFVKELISLEEFNKLIKEE